MRPEGDEAPRPGLGGALDGIRFLGRSRVLTGVLVADVVATLFAMPVALYPAINAERFDGSAAHPRAAQRGPRDRRRHRDGAVSGPLGRVRRPGFGMLISVAVWGARARRLRPGARPRDDDGVPDRRGRRRRDQRRAAVDDHPGRDARPLPRTRQRCRDHGRRQHPAARQLPRRSRRAGDLARRSAQRSAAQWPRSAPSSSA